MDDVKSRLENLRNGFKADYEEAEREREDAERKGQWNKVAHMEQKSWDYRHAYGCVCGILKDCFGAEE